MMKPVRWEDGRHEFSNGAQTRPGCGAARQQARPALLARIGLLVLLGLLTSACDSGKESALTTPPASRAPVAAAPADDCSTQADREALIEKQIAQGRWQKVGQVAKVFHVHVTPEFMAETSRDEQLESLAVISAYSRCAGGGSRVVIHDATTGEQIGQFSDAGLELK